MFWCKVKNILSIKHFKYMCIPHLKLLILILNHFKFKTWAICSNKKNYLFICMTIPGLQNPHCVPWKAASLSWMGCIPNLRLPRPSTVVNSHPSQLNTGVRHLRRHYKIRIAKLKNVFCLQTLINLFNLHLSFLC